MMSTANMQCCTCFPLPSPPTPPKRVCCTGLDFCFVNSLGNPPIDILYKALIWGGVGGESRVSGII